MFGRLRHDEGGFGLVESVIALGVIFTSLLALVYTATVGLSDIAFSRQRQQATGVANQVLEEVRGLPYEVIREGLSDSDLGGDSRIVVCSGAYYFESCPAADPNAEPILHTPDLPATSPLVPHTGIVGPPDYTSAYSWSVYVTEAADAPSAGATRVTVIVSWANAQRSGVNDFIQNQTVIYGPEGCVDDATHPFAGPCQAFFYGTGVLEPSSIIVTGTVTNMPFDSMALEFGRTEAAVQQEQVSAAQGASTLAAVKRTVGGVTTADGGDSESSGADSDPTTTIPVFNTMSLGPDATKNLSVSGGGHTMTLFTAGSNKATTTSTTAAGGSNPCNGQADGRPCGYGTVQLGEKMETTFRPDKLNTASLADVARHGTPDSAYVRRVVPSGLGTIQSTVARTIPEIRLGGLPQGISGPANWPGYWIRIANYGATAEAEAGKNADAPDVNITGGTITAWRAAGPETTAITEQGGPITINSLNYTTNVGGLGQVRIIISGTASVGSSSTSQTLDTADPTLTNDAEAVAGPPLTADISYQLLVNNVIVADLNIAVALGSATATASRQAATLS